MDAVWYGADYPSKHHETQVSIYHSLTGNEWLDCLVVMILVLLPLALILWNIERKN